MLNPKDIWIGDQVLIHSLQQQGTYEGISQSGKAKIKLNTQQILEMDFQDLSMHDVPEIPESQFVVKNNLDEKIPSSVAKQKAPFSKSLDLHFEILQGANKKELHESILEFQLRICGDFIKFHISKKSGSIHLVHGKGEGILKKEVEALLHSFSEVSLIVPRMDLGSIDVWLSG